MTAMLARAIMALSCAALGDHRRVWADAMQAEFQQAIADGHALSFATGCLAAACRDLPRHEEGRFVLASHALALGLMIPMAALQIGCALFGFRYLFPGGRSLAAMVPPGTAQDQLLTAVYQAAVPSLTGVLLLLGIGHLRIAWMLLERDWTRTVRSASLTAAGAATLIGFMTALFLDGTHALMQATVLVIELGATALLGHWHAQLPAAPQG